ncbi:uncharacterized protein LY89DRAFT_673732 [Mollisia scopiformis]|uniref:BRCT domain-containing protein n=1 Tax=Mollisia scopiformis TaxID=149040 RepID=A0A194WVD5_MOLSC|nr:uncharacterized protein LY89DRAFT_673732 [Mollisia scopiformis]KUJ11925.1 hypothetical protein LY89DRAFT_673732 [Mollisia scopiformis]
MPTQDPTIPPAAKPTKTHFDAWNSSSTGHQRAENRLGGSTGWRLSRTTKLGYQFKSQGTGGKRILDKVGAGSEDWDDKAKALIPKHVRERAKVSVEDMVAGKSAMSGSQSTISESRRLPLTEEEKVMAQRRLEDEEREREKASTSKGMFDGLAVYINGSTYPLISDHRLKQLLAENGARLSISLGRRQVTHVILGKPSAGQGVGAGGGLAGGKLEKEIRRVGGCGVRYVGAEWVLESIKAGKRLPETQFSNLKVAAKGQQSVYGMFKKSNSTASSEAGFP